ncbi:MAG: hypothetical protein R6X33_11885 [Candidatus Brocadiia bacterium]
MDGEERRIQPCKQAPWYWQYKGKPVLLLGGSDEDNLFQWTGERLTSHLDRLVECGGNYLRNTMSDRDEGDVYPFDRKGESYWLHLFNREYMDRLEFFLRETQKREIIVQLTLWDQHDFSGTQWDSHPWNPRHNQIGLEASGVDGPRAFFASVKERNALLLPYQEKFVDKILSVSLEFDHVLYNITNEGWAGIEWERHWARRIRRQAALRGTRVEVTDMQHGPEGSVEAMIGAPEDFSYAEISQNNNWSLGGAGQEHWDNIQLWRSRIEQTTGPRPINNVKVYGSDETGKRSFGDADAAVRRFFRIIWGGCASARFHRPNSGLGLGPTARNCIRSLRLFTDELHPFDCAPRNDLLSDRAPDSAYCLARPGKRYGIYFTDGGRATLDLSDAAGRFKVKWLGTDGEGWSHESTAAAGERCILSAPGEGPWMALLSKA